MRSTAPTVLVHGLRRAFLLALLLGVLAPSCRGTSITVEEGPHPPTLLKQRVRISVTLQGMPVEGVTVVVFRKTPTREYLRVKLDKDGRGVLQGLLPGAYFISFLRNDSSPGVDLDVCVIPCGDQWPEITQFVPTALHGPLLPLDEDARALDEMCIELDPLRGYVWKRMLAAAASGPITGQFRAFRGVVQDQAGGNIPNARIDVIRSGAEGEKGEAYNSDETGRFDLQLPDGDYVAIIQARGFSARTLHFVILHSSSAAESRIVLEVGNMS